MKHPDAVDLPVKDLAGCVLAHYCLWPTIAAVIVVVAHEEGPMQKVPQLLVLKEDDMHCGSVT